MPLPWDDVNATPARQVAEVLGLQRGKERGKYGCPVHGGKDSLHAYPGGKKRGFYCWGACDRAFSNVDLAAAVWGMEAPDACRELAGRLGMVVLDDAPPSPGRRSAPRPAPKPSPTPAARPEPASVAPYAESVEAAFAELRAEGCVPQTRERVYAGLLEVLTLTDAGAAYLAGRSLDPEQARAYGFRSIDGRQAWRALRLLLEESYLPEELQGAGFWYPAKDDLPACVALPFRGKEPALLIPYWLRGQCVALRLRSLAPEPEGSRYLNLTGAAPLVPFNAPALAKVEGAELHVTEGELDAMTARTVGWRAVGLPGVSTSEGMLRNLARGAKRAAKVVAWYDADAAGDRGFARLRDAMQEEHGTDWIRSRLVRRRPLAGKDLNELHQKGALPRD